MCFISFGSAVSRQAAVVPGAHCKNESDLVTRIVFTHEKENHNRMNTEITDQAVI